MNLNEITHPSHNKARTVLASPLYDPLVDFERQMTNPDCVVDRQDRDRIPLCVTRKFN